MTKRQTNISFLQFSQNVTPIAICYEVSLLSLAMHGQCLRPEALVLRIWFFLIYLHTHSAFTMFVLNVVVSGKQRFYFVSLSRFCTMKITTRGQTQVSGTSTLSA